MITSPSHAIELLGGSKAVADRLERPPTTVASWASRQSIPVEEWPKLIDLAQERKIEDFTYEGLVHAHTGTKKADGQSVAA